MVDNYQEEVEGLLKELQLEENEKSDVFQYVERLMQENQDLTFNEVLLEVLHLIYQDRHNDED